MFNYFRFSIIHLCTCVVCNHRGYTISLCGLLVVQTKVVLREARKSLSRELKNRERTAKELATLRQSLAQAEQRNQVRGSVWLVCVWYHMCRSTAHCLPCILAGAQG